MSLEKEIGEIGTRDKRRGPLLGLGYMALMTLVGYTPGCFRREKSKEEKRQEGADRYFMVMPDGTKKRTIW